MQKRPGMAGRINTTILIDARNMKMTGRLVGNKTFLSSSLKPVSE